MYIPVGTRGPESAEEFRLHSLGMRSDRELRRRAHMLGKGEENYDKVECRGTQDTRICFKT